MKRKRRKYPKAFTKYWNNVLYCGINEEDDFKEEAYLAWKDGRKNAAPLRKKKTFTASEAYL